MLKKFLSILFDILIIIAIGIIVYYFYVSNSDNSVTISETIKTFFPFLDSNSTSKALATNDIINVDSTADHLTNISNTNNYYYYKQLDDTGKIIYTALENNINNLTQDNFKIDFSTNFNNLLNQPNGKYILDKSFQSALDAFFYDHPDLFYIDLSKINLVTKYTTIGKKTTYSVSLAPKNDKNYLADAFTSEAQLKNAINQVETLKNNIVNNVSGNNYNKALIVHDTLVDLIEYDQTGSRLNAYNIYGALIEKQVVCEGYAKAFKYIMDSLNIPCILVSGEATNSSGKTESHMWNYIQLEDNWYGVDVTWDDPLIVGGSKNSTSNLRRTYFCKGYYTFANSHISDGKISDDGTYFSLPTLSKNNYK